jgi:hypothetical protein
MSRKREISPALNASVDEYFSKMPPPIQGIISVIRAEKDNDARPLPSVRLVDRSALLTPAKRAALLDFVASLVDENLTGRSDMCLQYALLIHMALKHLGITNRAVRGEAIYYADNGEEVFRWQHGWVRAGSEVIDGNTDSITENIMVPQDIKVDPYWGPIKGIPGRKLVEIDSPDSDPDITNTWWRDLEAWLQGAFRELS